MFRSSSERTAASWYKKCDLINAKMLKLSASLSTNLNLRLSRDLILTDIVTWPFLILLVSFLVATSSFPWTLLLCALSPRWCGHGLLHWNLIIGADSFHHDSGAFRNGTYQDPWWRVKQVQSAWKPACAERMLIKSPIISKLAQSTAKCLWNQLHGPSEAWYRCFIASHSTEDLHCGAYEGSKELCWNCIAHVTQAEATDVLLEKAIWKRLTVGTHGKEWYRKRSFKYACAGLKGLIFGWKYQFYSHVSQYKSVCVIIRAHKHMFRQMPSNNKQ